MTVSCVEDVRAGVWTGTAVNIDVTIFTRIDTIIGFVTDIGVEVLAGVGAKTDLEFLDMRGSLEDALRFC